MKIAHLIPQFYPYLGGAEICIHNVCRELSSTGHQAVVITTTPPPDSPAEINYQVIYLNKRTCGLLRKLPMFGKNYLRRSLAGLQKKYQFDLWQITMGYPLAIYAVDFFKEQQIPCIFRSCGEDIQKFPSIDYGYRLDPAIDRLSHEKYPLFDGLVALTPSVKEEYLAIGVAEEKIKIIPNGVDNARFSQVSKTRPAAEIRQEYGIGKDQVLILTVGRYHPKKGFDQIPAIATMLQDKGLDYAWVIAGKKSDEIPRKFPECEKLNVQTVEKFAKSGGHVFNLPSDDLIALYNAADLFVLPTLIETFGMVLVEAMAAGLPIITTDAPGVRDVIEDDLSGRKTPVGNLAAMADLINHYAVNRDEAKKLSQHGKTLALEKYDWQKVTSEYCSLYQELISQ